MMLAGNDNGRTQPHRENRAMLALALIASAALWLMLGLYVWRALGG
jgi:hypothetical protein